MENCTMSKLRSKKIVLDKSVLRELTSTKLGLVGGASVGCQSMNPGDFVTCVTRRCNPGSEACNFPTNRCAGESVRCRPSDRCPWTTSCPTLTDTTGTATTTP